MMDTAKQAEAQASGASGSGLSVRGLGKAYGRRAVVRNVSLDLQRGEVAGLLGPNGAGKTTCFYMITGLIRADSGTIMLDGADITDLPMYQRARLGIGYLPQEASIFRGLSVEDNVTAVAELAEPDRTRRKALVDELLEELNISHLRKARPWPCPEASAAGWRLPAPWPPSRASSFWTNPSPGSIRWPSPTSAT